MSGVSLAVGPKSDHDRKPGESPRQEAPGSKQQPQDQPIIGGVMGSLRVIELQLVAFIMVFSASGLVPLVDLLYPVFATIYAIFLSRFAFPSTGSPSEKELFSGGYAFRMYVALGSTVGLFLPLAYVLGGFARRDDHAVRSATPHLFLLSCQILTENVVSGLGVFSSPVRALLPLLYTVRRIFVIVDWIYAVWAHKEYPENLAMQDAAWVWFGRALATANLVYFSINLFGFLIPKFLPRAFERYFRMRDEVRAKTAEEKRAKNNGGKPGERKQD